jgi:hypothetical protein
MNFINLTNFINFINLTNFKNFMNFKNFINLTNFKNFITFIVDIFKISSKFARILKILTKN